jgi:hypothetical protein
MNMSILHLTTLQGQVHVPSPSPQTIRFGNDSSMVQLVRPLQGYITSGFDSQCTFDDHSVKMRIFNVIAQVVVQL